MVVFLISDSCVVVSVVVVVSSSSTASAAAKSSGSCVTTTKKEGSYKTASLKAFAFKFWNNLRKDSAAKIKFNMFTY